MENQHSNFNQKWKQNRVLQERYEIISIISIIVLLIVGLILDLIDTHILIVNDLATVSLTALQIQASISSISIALVALISTFVSEEYYGISVSRYFLNIKPMLFKQKRIIVGSICLVAINIGAHLFGAYNLVIAILWASCILIIVSVVELYSAFNGKHSIAHEIEMYLDYILFESSISYSEKANLFSDYIGYWSTLSQNKIDYENEKARYVEAIDALLEKNPEETLKLLQSLSSGLINKLSTSSDKNIKYRAIELFEETYNHIWKYIRDHSLKHIEIDFDLYGECGRNIVLGMNDLPVEDFERTVHWDRLVDVISRVYIYCHKNSETDSYSLMKQLKYIRWISSTVGTVLSIKSKNGEKISTAFWKYARRYVFLSDANIPDDVIQDFKKAKRQYEFAFYHSLLNNCQVDFASTIFKDHSLRYSDHKYDNIVFTIIVICYTYYVAERESLSCVSKDEKKAAKELLDVFKADGTFQDMIHTICWESDSVDFSNIYDEVQDILTEYEKFPIDGVKFCIVNNVVKDFILLILVLSSVKGLQNNLLDSVITGENAFSWYYSYLGNQFNETEKCLIQMIQILRKESPHNAGIIRRGLGEINSKVLNKYKMQSIADARKDYQTFVSKNQGGALILQLEEALLMHLHEKSEGWLVKPNQYYSEEIFEVLKFTTPVSYLFKDTKEILENIISHVENNFINYIINYLYKLKKLELFTREEENEGTYLDIISGNSYIMVGPDFAFAPYDYKRRKDFDQLTSGYRRINIGNGNVGMLLKKPGLSISVEKLSSSVQHDSFDPQNFKTDNTTGMYIYSPSEGATIQYTKEELEEYLFKESIILNVSVKLHIMNPTSHCGYVIVRKD